MKRIAVLLFLCCVFFSACAGPKWVRTTVAEQHEFNISLERSREKGVDIPRHYDHPHKIEISDLRKLMKDLKYVEESGFMGEEKQSPVFQTAEIDRLAPGLADALAKAGPSQRVRFISFNQGKTWIFSTPRKTEGVIFVEPAGRLNIAFNFINSKRESTETSAIDTVYSSRDPLDIKISDTPLSATAPYEEHHKYKSGKKAPMWVVADLEKLKESTGIEPAPAVETGEKAAPVVAPRAGKKVAPVEKMAPRQASEDMLKKDIKDKLKFLKELLDEGLISEEDYAAKKQELLDKIK